MSAILSEVRAGCYPSCKWLQQSRTPHKIGPVLSFPHESLAASPQPFRRGELRAQKLKSHLVRTQRLNVLPLKPGVGQYTAIHAMLTVREFFLISTLRVHSPVFFPKPLPIFFPVLAVANTWFLCRPTE